MPRPTTTLPVLLFLCFPISVSAQSAESSANSQPDAPPAGAPVVLFLEIASTPAEETTEAAFLGELLLVVDDLEVRRERPTRAAFAGAPLTEQITAVRPAIERLGATAAVWLARTEDPERGELLVVHVLGVSDGRALLRIVEASPDPGTEGELAPAVRELLESYRPSAPEPSPWSVLAEIGAQGGIVGQEGPSSWIGGSLGLSRRLVDGLLLWLRLGCYGGPVGSSSVLDADGWAMETTIGLTYLWELGRVSLGPSLGLRSWWSNTSLQVGDGPREESGEWLAQLAARLELKVPLSEKVGLTFGGGLAVTPYRDTYNRYSDRKIVYATPYLSWEGGLGIAIPIP